MIVAASAWVPTLVATRDEAHAATVAGRLAAYVDRDFRAARATAQLHRAFGRAELAAETEAKARALAGERDLPATATR